MSNTTTFSDKELPVYSSYGINENNENLIHYVAQKQLPLPMNEFYTKNKQHRLLLCLGYGKVLYCGVSFSISSELLNYEVTYICLKK